MAKKKTYEEEAEELPPQDISFEDVAQEEEALEGEVINSQPKTLSQELAEGGDLSDMQSFAKELFPDLGDVVTNARTKGRIFPDVFLPQLNLACVNEIMTAGMTEYEVEYEDIDEDGYPVMRKQKAYLPKAVDVDRIHQKQYVASSIGQDGMGRIDLLELAGAAKKAKEKENLSNSLTNI